ncbi:MAG: metalloregulator ArsR/SmtB family transcription factor [Clostridiaceae bacterium]|nr:metalloregulator ArsR/SmtB family transcription factor [Clostridiaceae bacterium]
MLSSSSAAQMFKALSDETRLKIVDMVSGTELCACDILEEFELTQPTLSYHMKILTDCGLVNARKDAAWTRYTLNTDSAKALNEFLELITAETDEVIAGRQGHAACNGHR